ncbi:hypothetical protein FQN54_004565 [Arachnomyces sp. PD_36]|nr:hypothetical protein FQN54_004565 [Arachnomyces sp. PD_36]
MDSENNKEKKPVPKFTSFRPKPVAQLETQTDREAERSSHRGERSRHRSNHSKSDHDSRSRRRSRDRHTHRRRDSRDFRDLGLEKPQRESTPSAKAGPPAPEHFFEDRKGDRYNVIYGTLHRYSAPQYNRLGRGSVLGLFNSYKIDRNLSDEATVVITDNVAGRGSSKQKTKHKNILSKLNNRGSNLIRIRPNTEHDGSLDAQRDFLPLDSHGGRKRRRLHGAPQFAEDQSDYRSIEPTADPAQDLSSDLEEVSDSDLRQGNEVDLDDNEEAKIRQVELNKGVQEHPDDPSAWLALIDHQDALIATASGNQKRKLTAAETQSVADIKISMYEKALSKLKMHTPRDRLLLGMLEEGSKIWDTKKLSRRWRDVLKENPQYISLWTKYLDFQQTQFIDFTYDQCRSIFTNSLKTDSGSDLNNLENVNIKLYLFLRMTMFMREAGFTEHAVGLWQAMLEFNLFTPQKYETSKNSPEAMSSFAEFWETEVARIGELHAKGWGGVNGTAVEPQTLQSKGVVDNKSLFESWVTCEREREVNSRLPARTLDEVEEDDPYRVILFSDIEEFLIPFSGSIASDLLINSFLAFCLLPPLVSDETAEFVGQWRGDPFLRNDLLDRCDGEKWLPDLKNSESSFIQTTSRAFPFQNFLATSDTLFADGGGWFSSLEVWKKSYLDNDGLIDTTWVRRALRSLVDKHPTNDSLAEYTLAVEFVCNPKEAKKYGKSLLKKRSSNLRLYNAYALLECRNGNLGAAEHVWTTTVSMSKGFAPEEGIDRIILWRTWLWELVNKRDYVKAVRLLLAVPETEKDAATLMARDSDAGTSISPAEFLKIQRYTRETQDYALSLRKGIVFVSITECLALLYYITKSSDIDGGLQVYKNADELLIATLQMSSPSISFFREILHQAKAKLLHHHINSTRKYKPATIRHELEGSIKLFPQNTIFLSIYAQNETARFLRIDDHVRALTRELFSSHQPRNLTADSIVHHFFSVFSELQRGAAASRAEASVIGTAASTAMPTAAAHSVRAAFEHAFDTSAGRSSAALWKLYVLFEISQGRADLARQAFYRGVRACPWAKALVMVAFTHLRQARMMNFEELRKVYNILVEKELRIHVDIEEILEDYDAAIEEGTAGESRSGHGAPPFTMPHDASDDNGD